MSIAIHYLRADVARTHRQVSGDRVSKNARLLEQAGYVSQVAGGVYTYLPLGLRVLSRVEAVIRQEMELLGAREVLGATLTPKGLWERTARWDSIDVLYKLSSRHGGEYAMAATGEELLVAAVSSTIRSFRDLPFALFQIGTKYRDEHRPRSGLLRGRDFRMKDLYSFHIDKDQLDQYYESVCAAYGRVFERCGLGRLVVRTFASGGVFSRFSDEFQMLAECGEDTIFMVEDGSLAINKEVAEDSDALHAVFGGKVPKLVERRSIEVGNTFKLGTRYTEAFGLRVAGQDGALHPISMCSYGIGSSRLVGAVVEAFGDERGLVWPAEISPYDVHIIAAQADSEVSDTCEVLRKAGLSALVDDRADVRLGEKFVDADLIGIPVQIVMGGKQKREGELEIRHRINEGARCVASRSSLIDTVRSLQTSAVS